MNTRMERFAEYYAMTGNATESAKKAGYAERTAYSAGARLLRNVEVQQYLADLQEGADEARIATIDEIKTFWTTAMRSIDNPLVHRLKASELLAKAAGAFVVEVKEEITTNTRESRVVIYLPKRDPDPEELERMYPGDDLIEIPPPNE